MRVSLIVASEPDIFNHKQQNFFASVAAQTYPHDAFEIIFVDGQSRASTSRAFAEFRQQHPAISATLLNCPSPARATQNNMAAAQADGDLLVFLADDFDPSPGLIAAYAEYHILNPDLNAVGIGPGLFPDHFRKGIFPRWLEDSGKIFGVPMRRVLAVWPKTFFYAGNASIRKAKFQSLGGFDERFLNDAWDDFEFGVRWVASGGYSQFVACATATHRHAVTFDERCSNMEHAGKAARVLEKLHPNLDHAWRTIIHRDNEPLHLSPEENAPVHLWIAFYVQQMDAAFRYGYLGAAEAG
ncbi:MAG: glycosyltransferase [Candidatus Nitrotoga sp.]